MRLNGDDCSSDVLAFTACPPSFFWVFFLQVFVTRARLKVRMKDKLEPASKKDMAHQEVRLRINIELQPGLAGDSGVEGKLKKGQ